MMNEGELYDDDDYRPAMSGEPDEPTTNNNNAMVATPESRRSNPNNTDEQQGPLDPHEEAEAAAAAAEVAVMEGVQRNNRSGRDPNADRALMGAALGEEDGVRAHEATDESGELVRGAFEEFLQN